MILLIPTTIDGIHIFESEFGNFIRITKSTVIAAANSQCRTHANNGRNLATQLEQLNISYSSKSRPI